MYQNKRPHLDCLNEMYDTFFGEDLSQRGTSFILLADDLLPLALR